MRSCRTGQGPWRVAEPGCLVVTGNLAGGLGRGLMHHGAGFCTKAKGREGAGVPSGGRPPRRPTAGPRAAPCRRGEGRSGVRPAARRRAAYPAPPRPAAGPHAGKTCWGRGGNTPVARRCSSPPARAARVRRLRLRPARAASARARRPPRSPGAAAIRCVRGRVTRGVGAGRGCGEARVSALFISRGCNESRWILNRWPAIMG